MRSRRVRRIDLALQGGGAHGAFTWGVLERILEDDRIEIDAISGTSAGAMNAVVLADGLMAGGRVGAREALRRFWSRVSNASGRGPMVPDALGAFFGNWSLEGSPLHIYLDWVGRSMSPQQFNPFDLNPLRDLLAAEIDFERVRACDKVRLFVSATNVRTGRLKEFRQAELSADAVMASACLPLMFRAVEIDGEAYWDGGYLGNPSLLPLIAESPAHDLVLVQINPSRRESIPTTPQGILDRLDEITFNSSLVKELRSLALLQQLLRQTGEPTGGGRPDLFSQVAALRMHRIQAEAELAELSAASKLDTGWPFLSRLHRIGYRAAEVWLKTNFTHLGRRFTMPLEPYLS
ncbi:MAG: patatin-like phospholipase family protein [Burkholderiaceae bacterium]|nr:patatin-like phospholipase family protein [Burkholderiaceae bacterium]